MAENSSGAVSSSPFFGGMEMEIHALRRGNTASLSGVTWSKGARTMLLLRLKQVNVHFAHFAVIK